jgi:hypothetical protein
MEIEAIGNSWVVSSAISKILVQWMETILNVFLPSLFLQKPFKFPPPSRGRVRERGN